MIQEVATERVTAMISRFVLALLSLFLPIFPPELQT